MMTTPPATSTRSTCKSTACAHKIEIDPANPLYLQTVRKHVEFMAKFNPS
jgi:hypothetical protein